MLELPNKALQRTLDTFIRVSIGALMALTTLPAMSAIETGDYLFLYGQVLGCKAKLEVVDYAEVLENGDATFLNGAKLAVLDLNSEQIAANIAKQIGEKTGREPTSLFIQVVPGEDHQMVLDLLMRLQRSISCDEEAEMPERQLPIERYNLRLASGVPPNKAPQRTLDPSVLFVVAKSTAASSAAELRRYAAGLRLGKILTDCDP